MAFEFDVSSPKRETKKAAQKMADLDDRAVPDFQEQEMPRKETLLIGSLEED